MSGGLVIKQLSLSFAHAGGLAAAVNACDLAVMPNEIVGLVGESGSGKSLSALACLGLTPPNCRISGSVQIAGTEIIGASEATLAPIRGRKIAMIFQNPMTALNPFFTIGEQMMGVIRRHFSVDINTARASVSGALAQSGLTDIALKNTRIKCPAGSCNVP
ncbi:MAG: ABC transporter ATP-binding protein [Rhodocyclaceae bacterium]|nr:ABC transporter ATP-binding protein [Rhodocyclaceae bacterium]